MMESTAAERLASLRQRNRYKGDADGQWHESLDRCAWRCASDRDVWQCSRNPGHGYMGAYCKQHAKADEMIDKAQGAR
jgi:hypothetical protein